MNSREFAHALDTTPAVRLTRRQWATLGRGFEETARRDTCLAGDLLIGRLDGRWLAVEEASEAHLAVRRLKDRRAADRFVAARMEAYDRLWDG